MDDITTNLIPSPAKQLTQQTAQEKIDKLVAERDEARAFSNALLKQPGWYDLKTVADELSFKSIGRNNLFKWLREHGWLCRNNEPKREYVESGMMKRVDYTFYNRYTDKMQVGHQTVMSRRGICHLQKCLSRHFPYINQYPAE
jgi:phage antirepressor YoqD-like protein